MSSTVYIVLPSFALTCQDTDSTRPLKVCCVCEVDPLQTRLALTEDFESHIASKTPQKQVALSC